MKLGFNTFGLTLVCSNGILAHVSMQNTMSSKETQPAKLITGIALVAVGIIFMLNSLDLIRGIDELWPLFMILIGLAFLIGFYLRRGNPGMLFVGLLITLNGLFFLLWNFGYTGLYDMGELWPTFMLIPGISFIIMALVSREERKALIPGFILVIVAAIFYLDTLSGISPRTLRLAARLWPLVLILVGAKMILKHRKTGSGETRLTDPKREN